MLSEEIILEFANQMNLLIEVAGVAVDMLIEDRRPWQPKTGTAQVKFDEKLTP